MKKIILLTIISLYSTAFAASTAHPIDQQIEDLITKTDPNINIGIKIKNLDKNIVIYEKNIDRYFTFASGLKLVTLVTLLEELGADYKFDSSILAHNHNNDYYLDIHDPEFSTQDLETLILSLKSQGINSIKGHFYIVNQEFLLPPVMRSKTVSDTIYCNSGLVTRAHINKNCARVGIAPTELGQKVQIFDLKPPEFMPFEIVNTAITTPDSNLDLIYTSINDKKYIISGTLNKSTGKLTIGAVTNDNFGYIRENLAHILQKHNIKLHG